MAVLALFSLGVACLLAACVVLGLWYISQGGAVDGEGGGSDGGSGGSASSDDGQLPPPSKEDGQCITSMGNAQDSGDCFALMYNHCTPGYMSQAGIPAKLQQSKKSIMRQMYQVQQRHFDKEPTDWTTFCLARPDQAGKGKCASVKPGEFRVWAKARLPEGANPDPCAKSRSLFIKAHFEANGAIQDRLTGTVGHG